jgi:hypothetical protein
VAADAVPAVNMPAMPTPPTKVSVAAAAATLLLMDINDSSLGTPQPCPAHDRVELAPAAREPEASGPLGIVPAHGDWSGRDVRA